MRYKRLYVDVDGVINALRRGSYTIHLIRAEDGDETDIHMDAGAVKEFLDQFDEVVWATTWVNYPGLLLALEKNIGVAHMGFDRIVYDRAYRDGVPGHSSGKDAGVAMHYDANPAKSLWIDDDHGPWDHRITVGRDITLHTPNPRTGAYEFMRNFAHPL